MTRTFVSDALQLTIPTEWQDQSVQILTLPDPDDPLHPALAVTQHWATPDADESLEEYVRRQVAGLPNQLQEFRRITEHTIVVDGRPIPSVVFRYAAGGRQLRQQQLFVAVPRRGRLCVLSFTSALESPGVGRGARGRDLAGDPEPAPDRGRGRVACRPRRARRPPRAWATRSSTTTR